MLKMEKEYQELYGDIPKGSIERLNVLLDSFSLKRQSLDIFKEIKRITNCGWSEYNYTIYLLPKATPRPRKAGRGNFFYVKGASDNKKLFQKAIVNEDIKLITTPVKFFCTSYLPIPNSMSNAEKVLAELGYIRPVSKPDWDNLGKAYCDMIQDILLYDDSLVIEGISKKFYSVKPRIEIRVLYMNEYDSKFNKKKIMKGRN